MNDKLTKIRAFIDNSNTIGPLPPNRSREVFGVPGKHHSSSPSFTAASGFLASCLCYGRYGASHPGGIKPTVYCIGTFGLMMLSLLETIVVMNLRGRDSASQNNEADKDQSLSEDCGDKRDSFQNILKDINKLIPCGYICDMSNGEIPSEELRVAEKGSNNQQMEESRDFEKLSGELRELVKTLTLLLNSSKEEEKPSYWTKKTKTINKIMCLVVFAVDVESSERNCSYQDVLDHLNFTRNKELFSMIRPVKNYKQPVEVSLDVLLYAILGVREKDQQFVPYIWLDMWWQNELLSWNPDEFCGIKQFSLPTEVLWKPDITIEEMTEKDEAPPSPYLIVKSDGLIKVTNDQVLVSSCRMRVHKFPFDIQSCNISFKSVVHSVNEIQLVRYLNSSKITEWSCKVMRTQYEWLFVNMTLSNETVDLFGFTQSRIVCTIFMKRRSALYIINLMLPVLFFLCLDLSSFLISDSGGEKLSFKVTVLLAITVLQLILNEILPTSSNRVPLIGK
ncbi:5-hydroxytryptamine receptor 3A-like [Morone saxatilis]|uniref:5-hydroxytryptamine receptor 3A-like n=1 Tax=Morone saxatilis TaxID=34816 RepID=UPI0015E2020C|nr:5-hydroxytryptamine receptor 3A-like [Morone saxatilis]